MTLSPRTLRIWLIAIGGMGFLDTLHVLIAAFLSGGRSRAVGGWAGFAMGHPIVLAIPVLVYAVAWYRFVRRTDRLAWGIAAFAMLWLIVRTWTTAYATGHQDFIQGGATMLGWLLGAGWGRALGLDPSRDPESRLEVDRLAATGALAMFAATYVCAGTSKLINSDFEWTSGATIRLMAISHLAVDDTSILAGLRRWLARDPHAGSVLQYATVILQTGAFVALFGPRARTVWCTGLVLLHVGIYVSARIPFLTPLVLAAVFAIPWDRRVRKLPVSGGAESAGARESESAGGREPESAGGQEPQSAGGREAESAGEREAEREPASGPRHSPGRARRAMVIALLGAALVLLLVWFTPLGPRLRFQAQPWQLRREEGP